MAAIKSFSAGIKWGVIAGLVYVILLSLQHTYGASNPLMFGISKFVTYFLIIILFYLAGVARRKEMGGFTDFKDVFQTIFLTILITEIVYAVFMYVYLTYINPDFYQFFVDNTMKYMQKMNVPDADIDDKIEQMRDSAAGDLTWRNIISGIGMWVIIDSIFGLIFSAIIKRPKPTFPTTQL